MLYGSTALYAIVAINCVVAWYVQPRVANAAPGRWGLAGWIYFFSGIFVGGDALLYATYADTTYHLDRSQRDILHLVAILLFPVCFYAVHTGSKCLRHGRMLREKQLRK